MNHFVNSFSKNILFIFPFHYDTLFYEVILMAIKEDNKRISVKLTKDEYQIIEKLAKAECRSVSNFLYKTIKENIPELNQPNNSLSLEKLKSIENRINDLRPF